MQKTTQLHGKAMHVELTGAVFRIVRYARSCRIPHFDNGDELPLDFPLVGDRRRYVPDWLKLDFRGGKWAGSYGYGAEGVTDNNRGQTTIPG